MKRYSSKNIEEVTSLVEGVVEDYNFLARDHSTGRIGIRAAKRAAAINSGLSLNYADKILRYARAQGRDVYSSRISDSQAEEICSMHYRDGKSFSQIAKELGRSKSGVQGALKRYLELSGIDNKLDKSSGRIYSIEEDGYSAKSVESREELPVIELKEIEERKENKTRSIFARARDYLGRKASAAAAALVFLTFSASSGNITSCRGPENYAASGTAYATINSGNDDAKIKSYAPKSLESVSSEKPALDKKQKSIDSIFPNGELEIEVASDDVIDYNSHSFQRMSAEFGNDLVSTSTVYPDIAALIAEKDNGAEIAVRNPNVQAAKSENNVEDPIKKFNQIAKLIEDSENTAGFVEREFYLAKIKEAKTDFQKRKWAEIGTRSLYTTFLESEDRAKLNLENKR